MRSLNQLRRSLYSMARMLGDVNAVLGGPQKMLKRMGNKVIGRKVTRRIWFR